LVICLDGTGDKFDGDNSNIVHIVGCLKKSDPEQVVYYQSGVGTYNNNGLSGGVSAGLDMAIASGLGVHVRDAYKFLMQTYHEGDRICLFGFSRGAYTARCLAGMIHKVGLLPAHNVSQIQFAYEIYKDDSKNGWEMSRDFKRTFSNDVNVYFVGVFDSVASVGMIPRKLPLSSTPTNRPVFFRHAMALDEHRAKFKACRFQERDDFDKEGWKTLAELHDANPHIHRTGTGLADITHAEEISKAGRKSTDTMDGQDVEKLNAETLLAKTGLVSTDVEEVWFMGCHADVGGGAEKNEARHKLSQIPLRWMIRQTFNCNTGMIFDTKRLAEEGLDVNDLYPVYNPKQPPTNYSISPALQAKFRQSQLPTVDRRARLLRDSAPSDPEAKLAFNAWNVDNQEEIHGDWIPEQIEDRFDAQAPINDELNNSKIWWILEAWPIKVRLQPPNTDTWVKKVRMNLGRFRPVQELKPNLHWTVQYRMQEKDYKTRTRNDRNAQWNIVA